MQFIFHIGPSKTGTSAIQYWCETHRDELLKHNIYYPAHDVDANGISPGNLQSIYSIGEENNHLTLNTKKLQKLIGDAEEQGANTVLLSSEFFFKRVNELAEHVPGAKFIAYIRFELELLESNYNQAVKRHKRVVTFKSPKKSCADSIRLLSDYIGSFGIQRFILRPYSKTVFKNNNIVSDFLAQIPLSDNATLFVDSRKINPRYSADGVEFKRWLNQYELGPLQEKLDIYLQAQGSNAPPYSFINRDTFNWLKAGYLEELENFFKQHQVADSDRFIRECRGIEQDPIRVQYIDRQRMSALIKGFITESKENAQLILRFYQDNHAKARSWLDKAKMQLLYAHLPLALKVKAKLSENGGGITSVVSEALRNSFERQKTTAVHAGQKVQKRWANSPSRDVYPSVEVVSHHIPNTSGKAFALALSKVYRGSDLFNAYSAPEAKALKNGQSIWLPSGTRIVHGHFPFHENQLKIFPNAVHICWVRDPIERLWLHFNHTLNFQQPYHLHCQLLALAKQNGLSTLEDLFDEFMKVDQFSSIKNTYQAFLTPKGIDKFAFIGSIHKYPSELERLGELLGKQFPANYEEYGAPEIENAVSYEKNIVMIKNEYKFITEYL